ncbi:MAG: hypothetical protein KME12_17100 [Trichocoleus desertorum ATA4-8-CV12]|nr:hypothetical protein [Trichocoleus desertorum ATA4-8-CV12]
MLSRFPRRNPIVAPDQIFSAGFRDGINRRTHHPQFCNNSSYLQGYAEGCRSIPDSCNTQIRFSCPTCQQDEQRLNATVGSRSIQRSARKVGQAVSELIPFSRRSTLDSALQAMWIWEQDQKRFDFGTVALGYHNGWWLVLVSKDLHDLALPF